MAGLLEDALLLGLGTLSLAKKEAELQLREALKRHDLSDKECESAVKAVLEEGAKTRKNLEAEVDRILKTRGAALFPGFARIEALEARVAELEQQVKAAPKAKADK